MADVTYGVGGFIPADADDNIDRIYTVVTVPLSGTAEGDIEAALGGGDVVLGPGTFIEDQLDITDAGTTIEGFGPETVVQKSTSSANDNLFRVWVSNVTIRNLSIRGDKGNQPSSQHMGVRIEKEGDSVTLDGLDIREMTGDGIYVASATDLATAAAGLTVNDVVIHDCGRSNLAITAIQTATLTGIESHGSAINGLNIEHGPFDGVTIDGFTITGAARHGISVDPDTQGAATDVVIRNGTITDCGTQEGDTGVRWRNHGAGCEMRNVTLSGIFNGQAYTEASGTASVSTSGLTGP